MKNLFTKNKKVMISLFLSFFLLGNVTAQIWTNPIMGTNPGQSNPFTIGDVHNANITVSGIGHGPGVNGANANNRFNTNGWDGITTEEIAVNENAYFSFTLTPNTSYVISFTSFSFAYQKSSAANSPTNFVLRSSLDNFTSNIASGTMPGTAAQTVAPISLTGAEFQGIDNAVTFRLYAWSTGTPTETSAFSINDFTFNGTVTASFNLTLNPGTGTVSQTTFDDVTSVMLPDAVSPCPDWIFSHWALAADSPIAVANHFTSATDVTLFAVYKQVGTTTNIATLTQAEIEATDGTTSYQSRTVESTSGNWTGHFGIGADFIQITQGPTTTHVLSPVFDGIISSTSVAIGAGTAGTNFRTIRITDVETTVWPDADTALGVIGYGRASVSTTVSANIVIGFDNVDVSQFRIHAAEGVTRILGVEVTYRPFVFNSNPVCTCPPTIIIEDHPYLTGTAGDYTLCFGTNVTTSVERTITITGINLTEALEHEKIKYSHSGAFVITESNVTRSGDLVLDIVFTPEVVLTQHTATLEISSNGALATIQFVAMTGAELTTDVPEVTVTRFVYARDGRIHFTAAAGETVQIYNVLGQRVHQGVAIEGANSVAVSSGVVLVRIGNTVSKIVVR